MRRGSDRFVGGWLVGVADTECEFVRSDGRGEAVGLEDLAVEAEGRGLDACDDDVERGGLESRDLLRVLVEEPEDGRGPEEFWCGHGFDDCDVEEAVLHVGLDDSFLAYASGVPDEDGDRSALPEGVGCGVGSEGEFEVLELGEGLEGVHEVRKEAEAFLQVALGLGARLGGEAGDAGVQEEAVAGDADVYLPGPVGLEDLEPLGDGLDADVEREVVAGAAGEDPEGDVLEGVCGVDTPSHLVDGSVTAAGGDDLRAVPDGLAGAVHAVALVLRLVDRVAVLGGELVGRLDVGAVSAFGVEDDGASRGGVAGVVKPPVREQSPARVSHWLVGRLHGQPSRRPEAKRSAGTCNPHVFAVDLHVHTRFFHGHETAAAYYDPVGIEMAGLVGRLRGLDAVATTNHDYHRHLGDAAGLPTIPGIEVSTTKGHVLVVGPDPPAETEPGALTPAETVAMAHDRGCAAIIAHPFRNSTVRETDVGFDAVELNGKSPQNWGRAREVAARFGVPLVGGSDAHYPVEVGRAYTLVDVDALTPEAVVDAIRSGSVSVEMAFGPVAKALRHGYSAIHRLKGHDPPGVGDPPNP